MIDFDRVVESRRRLPFAKVPCARSNGGEDLLPPAPRLRDAIYRAFNEA